MKIFIIAVYNISNRVPSTTSLFKILYYANTRMFVELTNKNTVKLDKPSKLTFYKVSPLNYTLTLLKVLFFLILIGVVVICVDILYVIYSLICI